MLHNFPYSKVPVDHGNAFPEVHIAMRPVLRVTLRSPTGEAPFTAIVDSGADYCLFPLHLRAKLGLRMEDARSVSGIAGYGSSYDNGQDVLFWPLVLDIAPGLSISTVVGFAERQDEVGFGLLGQLGFFSKVAQVYFDHRAGWFAIKPLDPAESFAMPPGTRPRRDTLRLWRVRTS
jgi:hypothetical protein